MSVLSRLLLSSAERFDLPDALAESSHTAADFQYLIKSFIGDSKPYILKGFDVIQPATAIGSESLSLRVADSVVYNAGSAAGSFYYGLPDGNPNSLPIVPELRKNATNFIYVTFDTFDTTQDTRAFWDADLNGGAGGEFNQDVNTESVLKVTVNVSVSTFPENTIPICKVVVGASVIVSIQDCRDMMFRLGTGGIVPDPFNDYSFRSNPDLAHARLEPSTIMTSAGDPNPFQGGDKNIQTLKEWMDVVMTRFKELSGTTYWYEGSSTSPTPGVSNLFSDALGSTLKSKGEWTHSSATAGQATWSEDIHQYYLRDPRDIILRASTVNLPTNDTVAWINLQRDLPINGTVQAVDWGRTTSIAGDTINGVTGSFANLSKGDWVKKTSDNNDLYVRVEEFYGAPDLSGGTTSAALAQSVRVALGYTGTISTDLGSYTKGSYLVGDINITTRNDVSIQAAGGNFFWLAYRSDTSLGLASAVSTSLTIDITEADGKRARVTSTLAHSLNSGERITITTGAYAGTYIVEVEDTTNLFIQTTVTGDSLTQSAFYAVVTTAARSTAYSFSLESANHGFQTNEAIFITGTSSVYDASFSIAVRSATSFQIPMPSAASLGAINGSIVNLPRLNVRTEFGTVKVVQGESTNIGDMDSVNLLSFIGMSSLAQNKPVYNTPTDSGTLHGHQDYNSSATDDLTTRISRLTSMMADRVQDRSIEIVGRTNITSVTSGSNQNISALANLTIVKPSSPDQAITLTSPISLPANSAIIIDINRDGSSSITPSVISLGSTLLLQENRIVLFYRFGTTTVYDWKGNSIVPSGHINTEKPEDSQNKNIVVFNPGTVQLNNVSNLLTLKLQRSVEITDVTTVDASGITPGSYWIFSNSNNTNNYYVWYKVDGVGTDPAVVGRTGILVSVLSTDLAASVATQTNTALSVAVGVTTLVVSNVITITNTTSGESTDAQNGTPSPTFTISVVQQGFHPNIELVIPGSTNNNIIDVDAINTLGTLLVPDNYSVWVRIDRFNSKTFNTIQTSDLPDTDGAGSLYITTTASTPIDQDVIVLWARRENNILVIQHSQDPKGNVYEEFLEVVASSPGVNQVLGPVAPGTTFNLPLDTRDGSSIQEYVVGSGQLEIFLNGDYLRVGNDWSEFGNSGAMSSKFTIQRDLVAGDVVTIRIDAEGAVYFAAGSGGGGTLQDAYDGGRFITVTAGQPIVITGASGKLLNIVGDITVTGVIDPAGLTFSQSAVNPLSGTDFGLWRNASDELIYSRGGSADLNISSDFVRRDGTLAMTASLDLGSHEIINLLDPTSAQHAATKNYADITFIKLDGSNPMSANLNMNSFKITSLSAGTIATDAVNYGQVILASGANAFAANQPMGGFKLTGLVAGSAIGDSVSYEQAILASGVNAFSANQSIGGFKLTNMADGTVSTDAATKGQMDTADALKVAKAGDTMTGNLVMSSNKITSLGAGTTAGDSVRYEQAILTSGANAFSANQSIGNNKLTNLASGTVSSDAVNYGQVILASGVNPFLSSQSMGGFKLTSVADPVSAQDAATKAYVDNPLRYTARYSVYTNNTGSTITAGTVVAASQSSSSEIIVANANSFSTTEGVVGVAYQNILTGTSGLVQVSGIATVSGSSYTIGKRVYLSSASGQGSSSAPTTIGYFVYSLGIATSSTTVELLPDFLSVVGNLYDESYSIVSGAPANDHELTGPISPSTSIDLPTDSRNGGASRSYVVGAGSIELYLNGDYLRTGNDWLEVGTAGNLSTSIIINQPLSDGDNLTFRINLNGNTTLIGAGGSGEANTASNLGSGSQVFKQKSGVDLQFRTLTAGSGVSIVQNTNDITISSSVSSSYSTTTKTSNYSATLSDTVILCDATAGNITISLPAASTANGKFYIIKKIDSSANSVIIDPNASELIDNVLTKTTTTQYESFSLVGDSVSWWLY